MASDYKKAYNTQTEETARDTVKVKFNFPLSSSSYDPSISMKRAKEEKSYIGFEQQNHIDLNTSTNFYEAGKIYDVPESFYKRFESRTVETYNPFFGKFEGKAKKFAERPKVPYLLKVDVSGNLLDPMQQKLDLYSTTDD